MVCVERVSTTIPKGGEIEKASYSSFLFLTKIGSFVNFIARNVFFGDWQIQGGGMQIYICKTMKA
jgi:hypothetical protein